MNTHCDNPTTSLYGAADVSQPLPTDKMPAHSMRPVDAFELIKAELLLDGNASQNLATFCQTWDDEQVHKLMDLSISKNMIDKDEYPRAPSWKCAVCA